MAKKFMVVAAGLLAFAANPPASAASSALVILKMSGDRGWKVDCTFERDGKNSLSRDARGRGDVETIAVGHVTSGSCSYEAPEAGVLQIRFRDERKDGSCPFEETGGECIGRFADGAKGTFEF